MSSTHVLPTRSGGWEIRVFRNHRQYAKWKQQYRRWFRKIGRRLQQSREMWRE